jgi:phosphoglycerate dehydrogenase-like enzyme
VVDEAALAQSLSRGRPGFAALDVAAVEPLPADSPLWNMENVLISPHSASTVQQENALITDLFIHNMRCVIEGRTEDMRNAFDMTGMY